MVENERANIGYTEPGIRISSPSHLWGIFLFPVKPATTWVWSGKPECQPLLSHWLIVPPQARHFLSLDHNFVTCKTSGSYYMISKISFHSEMLLFSGMCYSAAEPIGVRVPWYSPCDLVMRVEFPSSLVIQILLHDFISHATCTIIYQIFCFNLAYLFNLSWKETSQLGSHITCQRIVGNWQTHEK